MSTGLPFYEVFFYRGLFARLDEGGTWFIPRSGLIFQRRGQQLVLMARMPWISEMEGDITPAQLDEQQEDEYKKAKFYCEQAGITVDSEVDFG